MARHSLSHIARGLDGALFFQWRASRGGAEMYHSAMVPHAGPDRRVFREAIASARCCRSWQKLLTATSQADVAILWDVECWWAMQGPICRRRHWTT